MFALVFGPFLAAVIAVECLNKDMRHLFVVASSKQYTEVPGCCFFTDFCRWFVGVAVRCYCGLAGAELEPC